MSNFSLKIPCIKYARPTICIVEHISPVMMINGWVRVLFFKCSVVNSDQMVANRNTALSTMLAALSRFGTSLWLWKTFFLKACQHERELFYYTPCVVCNYNPKVYKNDVHTFPLRFLADSQFWNLISVGHSEFWIWVPFDAFRPIFAHFTNGFEKMALMSHHLLMPVRPWYWCSVFSFSHGTPPFTPLGTPPSQPTKYMTSLAWRAAMIERPWVTALCHGPTAPWFTVWDVSSATPRRRSTLREAAMRAYRSRFLC